MSCSKMSEREKEAYIGSTLDNPACDITLTLQDTSSSVLL